jgi:hypothetical protein
MRVEYHGRITYRCTIDSRPFPTTIRLTDEGRIVGED